MMIGTFRSRCISPGNTRFRAIQACASVLRRHTLANPMARVCHPLTSLVLLTPQEKDHDAALSHPIFANAAADLNDAPIALVAQDSGVMPTSKILFISREYTKPGRDGTPHQMAEAAYVRAAEASKNSPHYLALSSLSGPSRTLFTYSYPSFEAMEKQHFAEMADSTYSAAIDRASAADGDLLSATDSSVWMMRDDLSLNQGFRTGAHLEEITQFAVRPGHQQEWDQLVKLVIEGYKKGVPESIGGRTRRHTVPPADATWLLRP